MKKRQLVRYAKVIDILEDRLTLDINGEESFCLTEDVSDYDVDLNKMFTIGRTYKFSIIYEDNDEKGKVSYKVGRPKLLKKRVAPTATISGFKTVNNKMHQYLKDYKVD